MAIISTVVAALSLAFIAPAAAPAAGCLRPPVDAPIVVHYDAPACPYCAGDRGVRYATMPGTPVRAAAAGIVTFSGVVVDVRYVVIRHAVVPHLRATYGGLASTTVAAGDSVVAGAIVGRASSGLYFGLRDDADRYVDPEPWLGTPITPPMLIPTDGTGRRPPPPPELTCPAAPLSR